MFRFGIRVGLSPHRCSEAIGGVVHKSDRLCVRRHLLEYRHSGDNINHGLAHLLDPNYRPKSLFLWPLLVSLKLESA